MRISHFHSLHTFVLSPRCMCFFLSRGVTNIVASRESKNHFFARISTTAIAGSSKSKLNSKIVTAEGQGEGGYIEEILLKGAQAPQTRTEKVKQGVQNTFFYFAFAVAVFVTSAIVYYIYLEFFTFKSPQRIYSKSVKMIRDDERCLELFGPTISAHGEDSGRGRRRHVANYPYVKDGEERVRVLFHIKGAKNVGKALAEVAKKNDEWKFRFLLVETVTYPKQSIVILDNRDNLAD